MPDFRWTGIHTIWTLLAVSLLPGVVVALSISPPPSSSRRRAP